MVLVHLRPIEANSKVYSEGGIYTGNISGSRKNASTTLYRHTITDEDCLRGYLEIPVERTHQSFQYINFYCSTDYGIIKGPKLKWFDN